MVQVSHGGGGEATHSRVVTANSCCSDGGSATASGRKQITQSVVADRSWVVQEKRARRFLVRIQGTRATFRTGTNLSAGKCLTRFLKFLGFGFAVKFVGRVLAQPLVQIGLLGSVFVGFVRFFHTYVTWILAGFCCWRMEIKWRFLAAVWTWWTRAAACSRVGNGLKNIKREMGSMKEGVVELQRIATINLIDRWNSWTSSSASSICYTLKTCFIFGVKSKGLLSKTVNWIMLCFVPALND